MKTFEEETVVIYYTVPKGTEYDEVVRVANNVVKMIDKAHKLNSWQ